MMSAGVAERLRRRAADSLYMGSNPIPGSTTEGWNPTWNENRTVEQTQPRDQRTHLSGYDGF